MRWDGAHGIAGEWGHVTLDPRAGPPCYCGRRGCVETYLSGPGDRERRTRARPGVALRSPTSRRRAAEDPDARATLDDVVATFGRAMATVVNVLDPDAIVLGGGVSNLGCALRRGHRSRSRAAIFNDELGTPIVKHALGDSAGVFGAALLHPPE